VPWATVIGQERVTDALARALEGDRVAHAYLFHGPEGVGKKAAALAFAQALLCERRGRGAPAGDACGRCLPCTKAARLLHPDLHVLLPYPKQSSDASDPLPEDYPERLRRLAANPYAPVDYRRLAKLDGDAPSNKQVEHRIRPLHEQVRRALGFVPVEGPRAVAVVADADAMRMEAANAFLKLLEEPSAHAVLILTAERVDQMLPTILSRCQRLRFDPLPPEVLEAALAEREGVEAGRAAFVARMADGSYTRALALLSSEDLAHHRQLALEFVRRAYALDVTKLMPLVEEVAKLGREPIKGLFSLMLGWVRDLVLYRTTGQTDALVNVDQAEAVQAFVARLPQARLDAMATLVEEAAGLIERNVHTTLLLTVLAHALHDAMRGRPRERLFAPLSEPALTA